MKNFSEHTFVALSSEELENANGGILPILVAAGIYTGGVGLGAATSIGVIKVCQWLKL